MDISVLWAKILWRANIAVGAAALVLLVGASVVSGKAAFWSVFFSWLCVGFFFSLSMLVVDYVWSKKPSWAFPAASFTFVAKTIIFGVVAITVSPLVAVDRGWFSGSALVFVIAWQCAEIMVIVKAPVADAYQKNVAQPQRNEPGVKNRLS